MDTRRVVEILREQGAGDIIFMDYADLIVAKFDNFEVLGIHRKTFNLIFSYKFEFEKAREDYIEEMSNFYKIKKRERKNRRTMMKNALSAWEGVIQMVRRSELEG